MLRLLPKKIWPSKNITAIDFMRTVRRNNSFTNDYVKIDNDALNNQAQEVSFITISTWNHVENQYACMRAASKAQLWILVNA